MTIPKTEHKGDTEQTGEKAADLFRQITGFADDIIFIIGEDRSIRFTNREPGTSGRSSRPGGSIDGPVAGDIYRALKESIETVFNLGKPLSIERRFGKPGDEIWLHTRLTPITGDSAKVSSVLGIARDISELKRKEQLIANSRAEWLKAVDAMPHFLAVVGPDCRIQKANKALADYLGISLQNLQGRICRETFGAQCLLESCPTRRSGPAAQGSVEFQSDLQGRAFLVTISPLTDESGNTTGCLFIARDPHGPPDAAELRKKNAEEIKNLLKRSEYLVTVQDENGSYLSMRTLPHNIRLPEGITGKTPFDFFEPETANKICERIKKAVRSGRDFTVSTELQLGEDTFHLLEHISPIRDETGGVSALMTVWKKVEGPLEKSKSTSYEARELTKREHEILQLISSGLSTSQIAEKLFISRKTVETHRSRIMRKLGIHKASALVRYAVKSGLF